MIFDGKPLSDIEDSEIARLVTEHVSERQNLEFKVTINLNDDAQKFEALKDIASLANGGGGYLIVGIRDDGNGRAQVFEPTLVGDTQRIRQSLRDLCLEHIHDRILDLEFQCRSIEGNPVLVIRVPASERLPHMVGFNRHTDFLTRHDDGKREMTLSEIRDLFRGDLVSRRLAAIEAGLGSLRGAREELTDRERGQEALETGSDSPFLTIRSGPVLSNLYRQRFERHAAGRPYFAISAVPAETTPYLVDLESEEFLDLLNNPPCSRWAGWDMNFEHFPVRTTSTGLIRGVDDFRTVEIWRNGFVELRVEINSRFGWGQKEEEFAKRPSFNPVTLSEYIVSFVRFYARLLQITDPSLSALLNLQYFEIKGFRLRSHIWHVENSEPFEESNLIFPDYPLPADFEPEVTAFNLVKLVFNSFGMNADQIPAWNRVEQQFEFEKLGN